MSLGRSRPTKSYVGYWQTNGRVYRTYPAGGKTKAIIVDPWDHVQFLDKHGTTRYKYLCNEPAIEITRKTLGYLT